MANGLAVPPAQGAGGDPVACDASQPPCPAGGLLRIHHAAIICSDYAVSRHFYTAVLGLPVLAEHYRTARDSWKLDLQLPDGSQVELFSMPQAPQRPSYPEACGLRHLAFAVSDLQAWVAYLSGQGVALEAVRLDDYTGQRFVFFQDPDQLPLELYEVAAVTRP